MGKASYQKNIEKIRQMKKNKNTKTIKKNIEKIWQINKNKNIEKLKKTNIIT